MNPIEWKESEEDFPSFEISTVVESSPIPFGKQFSNKHYSAGLSHDCSSAFFLSERSIVVYSLENFPRVREMDVRLSVEPPTRGEYEAAKATLTKRFLAVIARGKVNHQLFVYEHGVPIENGGKFGSDLFHTWYPTCLAMHESRDRTWVAVGGVSNKVGSIRMYQIEEVRGRLSFRRHDAHFENCVPNALYNDPPKVLDFSPDCRRLVALTSKRNKVLVWSLSNNARPRQAAFEIMKRYEGVSVSVS
jgi:hypothetical protein